MKSQHYCVQHLIISTTCRAGQWDALLTAHKELCQNSDSGALAVTEGFVDHAQLFSRCCALVHHGGAGTVAAALRAGLPSVVCPLQFDQFMWVRYTVGCLQPIRQCMCCIAFL